MSRSLLVWLRLKYFDLTFEQQLLASNIMVLAELAVYAIGLGIFMSSVCLASLNIEKFRVKVNLLPLSWLGMNADQAFEISELKEKVTESRLPASWWTDENQYQLECRAIFSKVCTKHDIVS